VNLVCIDVEFRPENMTILHMTLSIGPRLGGDSERAECQGLCLLPC